mgnify:CR=1 FL=1
MFDSKIPKGDIAEKIMGSEDKQNLDPYIRIDSSNLYKIFLFVVDICTIKVLLFYSSASNSYSSN